MMFQTKQIRPTNLQYTAVSSGYEKAILYSFCIFYKTWGQTVVQICTLILPGLSRGLDSKLAIFVTHRNKPSKGSEQYKEAQNNRK